MVAPGIWVRHQAEQEVGELGRNRCKRYLEDKLDHLSLHLELVSL